MFDHCIYHPSQKILDKCIYCEKPMNDYMLNKGKINAFHCKCGNTFLNKTNQNPIFSKWDNQYDIQNKLIIKWLDINERYTQQNKIFFPFGNYEKKYFANERSDYLSDLPSLILNDYDTNHKSDKYVSIDSNNNIFNIQTNYEGLKEKYINNFNFRYYKWEFDEKDKIDSYYFDVYLQYRIIYKSISRYIRKHLINKHNKCIQIFNKANQSDDVCPFALSFIFWKMECEDMDNFWELNNYNSINETYNFERFSGKFSYFVKGTFISHLSNVLNNSKTEFDSFNLNSINYFVNRILGHLLIERYIKWLELIQHPLK